MKKLLLIFSSLLLLVGVGLTAKNIMIPKGQRPIKVRKIGTNCRRYQSDECTNHCTRNCLIREESLFKCYKTSYKSAYEKLLLKIQKKPYKNDINAKTAINKASRENATFTTSAIRIYNSRDMHCMDIMRNTTARLCSPHCYRVRQSYYGNRINSYKLPYKTLKAYLLSPSAVKLRHKSKR